MSFKVEKTEDTYSFDAETLAAALNCIPLPIILFTEDGTIEYGNLASLTYLELEYHDLTGRSVRELFGNQFLIPTFDEAERQKSAVPAGAPVEAEIQFGQLREEVRLSFGRILKHSNGLPHILTVIWNNLQYSQQERPQLDYLVSIQERMKSLGNMAMNLVHQLSQPVAAIRLDLDLTMRRLSKGKMDREPLQESLLNISELVGRVTEIINETRYFARHATDDAIQPVDALAVLHHFTDLRALATESLAYTIRLQSPEEAPNVCANEFEFEQVLQNIIAYYENRLIKDFRQEGNTRVDENFLDISVSMESDAWICLQIRPSFETDGYTDLRLNMNPAERYDQELGNILNLATVRALVMNWGGDLELSGDVYIFPDIDIRLPIYHERESLQLQGLISLVHRKRAVK